MARATLLGLHLILVVMMTVPTRPAATAMCGELCNYIPRARDADCSRRYLSKIPLECAPAKTLNLNKNNITEVPGRAFSAFPYLKYLQLLESNVHSISDNSFAGATKLKCVNLLKNWITRIPAHAFNDTIGLRWVYFSRNRIHSIGQGVFQESPLLEMLFLDFNRLENLGDGIFQGLTEMQRLLLGSNQLRVLPVDVFSDLTKLNYLDLSHNQIQSLSNVLFTGLHNLQTIKLEGNGLVNILPGTFAPTRVFHLDISLNNLTTARWDKAEFTALSEIRAGDNPWRCDCSLDPFRVALVNLTQASNFRALCAVPESIAGTDVASNQTLCSISDQQPKLISHNGIAYGKMGQEKEPTEVVATDPKTSTSEIIILIVVVTLTVIALLGMGVFLFITTILPKMCRTDRPKRTNSPEKV